MLITREDFVRVAAFCDPSAGKRRQEIGKSSSALSVVARTRWGHVMGLYAWEGQVPTDELVEKIFETHKNYLPDCFGIEANGLQSLFGDMVFRESQHKRINIKLESVKQPTNISKERRIQWTLDPLLKKRAILLDPDLNILRGAIEDARSGWIPDILDAFASAVVLATGSGLSLEKPLDEHEAYRDYLHAKSVAPWDVEERLRQFERFQTSHLHGAH